MTIHNDGNDEAAKKVGQSNSKNSESIKSPPESSKQPTSKPRGIFATIFSHLAVAAIAVIGVGAYMHWDDILNYTGSRVCAYDMLGQYAKTPTKVPSIEVKKTPQAAEKSTVVDPKKQPVTKAEAETKKPEQNAKVSSFKDKLQAARKLFWENDKAAVGAYEVLVVEKPQDAELLGEMANVYYKNDATEKAVQSFFNAGKLHLEQKKADKVASIVKVLKKISPEKSAELSKLSATAGN